MKSKIHLEVYESDILNSIATQSKEETFDFVSKILNSYEHPSEVAGELLTHIEKYIEDFQQNEFDHDIFLNTNDDGRLDGKYKPRFKKERVNKKPPKEEKLPHDKAYFEQRIA